MKVMLWTCCINNIIYYAIYLLLLYCFVSDLNNVDVEEMVLQLFELVNEKNELFRKHAELMYLYVFDSLIINHCT